MPDLPWPGDRGNPKTSQPLDGLGVGCHPCGCVESVYADPGAGVPPHGSWHNHSGLDGADAGHAIHYCLKDPCLDVGDKVCVRWDWDAASAMFLEIHETTVHMILNDVSNFPGPSYVFHETGTHPPDGETISICPNQECVEMP